MRIIDIRDHTKALQSGYAFRAAAVFPEQRALSWETFHLPSPKRSETVIGLEDVEEEAPLHACAEQFCWHATAEGNLFLFKHFLGGAGATE